MKSFLDLFEEVGVSLTDFRFLFLFALADCASIVNAVTGGGGASKPFRASILSIRAFAMLEYSVGHLNTGLVKRPRTSLSLRGLL